MTRSVFRPAALAVRPLAVVLASVFSSSTFAQVSQDAAMAPVVVTANRFPNDPAFPPVGATVITAREIRDAGISDVNTAIRKLAGVYGRQSLIGTSDYSLDLRGFGLNSDQNQVVLLDGIRLSENELNPALLSTIPIDQVERIEVIRGGSSVLYGEGATGGVIQIITKRGAPNAGRGSLVGEVGSYGQRELRGSAARSWDGLTVDANVSTQRSDNYRHNNTNHQRDISTGVQWASNEGRVGLRVDSARQESRFPGPLSLDEFRIDPRRTNTPDDFGSYDVDRITLFGDRRIGAIELAADFSHREKSAKSNFSGFSQQYQGRMTQFSPRIRHLSDGSSLRNELLAGIDITRWVRETQSDFSLADATQTGRAAYLRDELKWRDLRISAGLRREIITKRSTDVLASDYRITHGLNAWELLSSYTIFPKIEAYAKTGLSYRVANVDDNAFTLVPGQPLQPQKSHDNEVGATLGDSSGQINIKWFQHRLTNEIALDPASFANVNLDATKRQGVELEAKFQLVKGLSARASFQHVAATFSEGPYAGAHVPLVPSNNAAVRLNWVPTKDQTVDVGAQWAGSQRYGNDFSNACTAQMPSYTTLDARYAHRFGSWEVAVAGSNLADRQYYAYGFSSSACTYNVYPDAGRQLKLTIRTDF